MTCRVSRVPACLPTLAAVLESGDGGGPILARVAVMNGVDAYIALDNLAPVSYAQSDAESTWWVLVARTADTGARLVTIGNGALSGFAPVRQYALLTGDMYTTGQGVTHVSSLYGADDTHRVFQYLDRGEPSLGVNRAKVAAKVDSDARQIGAVYVRAPVDATFPWYITLSGARYNAPPNFIYHAGSYAYLALVRSAKPSDAQQDEVDAALSSGGLIGISNKLVSLAATLGGVVEWAGPLDGLGAPHVDNGPYGNPVFVNATWVEEVIR
jgi:hypothetical protein